MKAAELTQICDRTLENEVQYSGVPIYQYLIFGKYVEKTQQIEL